MRKIRPAHGTGCYTAIDPFVIGSWTDYYVTEIHGQFRRCPDRQAHGAFARITHEQLTELYRDEW
jgi:hypothetical protein